MPYDCFICPICGIALKRYPITIEHGAVVYCPNCRSDIVIGLFSTDQWNKIECHDYSEETVSIEIIELNFD